MNASIPPTNTVTIQPYRAKKQDGTAAVVMGDASSEAYIKGQVDLVLAQSGLTLEWLPVIDIVDDFIYDGSPNDYSSSVRPVGEWQTGEFYQLIHSTTSSATVLKLYFVEIVPNFSQTSDNNANGYAYIDYNGVAIHIGANLPTFTAGRDVAASVIAHEIGHNLGLNHVANSDNLMYATNRSSERITQDQIGTIFTNSQWQDGYELLGAYAAPSNYALWAENLDLSGGPEGDDDHDGLSNVLEFMLDLDGSVPDTQDLPAPTWGPSGLVWTLKKQSDALEDGLAYDIEVSSDAANWDPAGTAGTGSTVVTDNATTYAVLLGAGAAVKYMRIRVDLTGTLLDGAKGLTNMGETAEKWSEVQPLPAPPRTSRCGLHGCGHHSLETP